MNVLQVVPLLESGGVERGTLEIAKALVKQGHGSYVATRGGKMLNMFEEAGVIIIRLPVHSKNPLLIILNIFLLVYFILKEKIHIIHARSRAPAWSCYFASKISNIKFITTFHGTYNISGVIKHFYNSVMLRSNIIIAVSNFILKHIRKNYSDVIKQNTEIIVINRGVDINTFDINKITEERKDKISKKINFVKYPNTKYILLPGRFVRWKGHLYLLECLKLMKDLNFICYFVGHCAKRHFGYYNQIKKNIALYGLEDKIKFANAVNDMPALYSLFDFVIMPSTRPEAFGRVIIEAQAMKKLVIATNHGGVGETISDRKTGFHIPVNNMTESSTVIQNAMKMSNSEYNDIMNAAFDNARTNYSIDQMCEKTLNTYKSLLYM